MNYEYTAEYNYRACEMPMASQDSTCSPRPRIGAMAIDCLCISNYKSSTDFVSYYSITIYSLC